MQRAYAQIDASGYEVDLSNALYSLRLRNKDPSDSQIAKAFEIANRERLDADSWKTMRVWKHDGGARIEIPGRFMQYIEVSYGRASKLLQFIQKSEDNLIFIN